MTEDVDAVTNRLVRPIHVNGTVVNIDMGYSRSKISNVVRTARDSTKRTNSYQWTTRRAVRRKITTLPFDPPLSA